MPNDGSSRRHFIRAVIVGAGCLAACASTPSPARQETRSGKGEEKEGGEGEVSPNEDLMREHGLLERILLVYDEAIRRVGERQDFDPRTVANGAGIVRHFIEDYHERLEEDYLFPRLEKAGQQRDLVATLRVQHRAGRRVTDEIIRLSTSETMGDEAMRGQLSMALHQFVRMYRPHAAREDTVLFPAFRKIVSTNEYQALGERFEEIERQKFGPDGFESVLHEVEGLERAFGIEDLARFTPA